VSGSDPAVARSPRRLRARLGFIVVGTVVLALVVTGVSVDQVFARLQRAALTDLLERDLERVGAVVRGGALGQEFLQDDTGGVRLQFVSRAGRVLLPDPEAEPIPLVDGPTEFNGPLGRELVAAGPWVLPSGLEVGTVRLALDLRAVDEARRELRLALAATAATVALLAGVAAVLLVGRALRPLAGLAREAGAIDASAPRLAAYRGPDDEVAEVARALNAALGAIRERQQAERDALAEVAHELAAPLSVVAGELRHVAAARPDDPRVRAARDAADELLHTSQDLLTLARGELEQATQLQRVDAAEVAASVAASYPGVRFTTDGGDARVFAHPDRLRQAVRNLVRNAVQAAGPERVRIGVVGGRDEVRLTVADEGPGMAPAVLARVFDRYVSGRAGGVGVGLVVAKRIVAALDGRIEARSTPGVGSEFEVVLPGWAAQVEDDG
jgi:two-component system, OmpR family, sensor kinase